MSRLNDYSDEELIEHMKGRGFSCSAQLTGSISAIEVDIIREAADFIERLPGSIIEAYGGRYPLCDELHGIALSLKK